MKETWPDNVIVINTSRFVKDEEIGFYCWWHLSECREDYPGDSLPGIVSYSKGDMFNSCKVHIKLENIPKKPKPILELEAGWYKVTTKQNKFCLAFRNPDGTGVMCSGIEDVAIDCFDTYFLTYLNISDFEKVD